MTKLLPLIAFALALALPGTALAQSDTDTKTVSVVGTAPPMCFGGTLSGAGSFDLGVLIDTATGQLRNDLNAPPKLLVGSLCTSRSTITVSATPLVAQNFTAAAPTGFAKAVDYTATASGWTTTPASYNTGAASNAAATQSRATAFTGDITVAISGFATTGGNSLRLVADNDYRGLVTVTIAAVN
ncbi:MAG: hypothetical protein C0515_04850 [Novosphingobium sp.]|nr:hypothetical protein [Novosphingobium sp.]MBX9644493.1 hypothetical protein [Novosphingobium sp.]